MQSVIRLLLDLATYFAILSHFSSEDMPAIKCQLSVLIESMVIRYLKILPFLYQLKLHLGLFKKDSKYIIFYIF